MSIVNISCSSVYSKDRVQSLRLTKLLSSVPDNLDDGKIKEMSDKQFKALFHLKRARHVCLATGHGTRTLI